MTISEHMMSGGLTFWMVRDVRAHDFFKVYKVGLGLDRDWI